MSSPEHQSRPLRPGHGTVRNRHRVPPGGLRISRELGDRENEGAALDALGATRSRLGQFEEALALHDRALVIFRDLKNALDTAVALQQSADALMGLGRPQEAVERYQGALAIERELKDPRAGVPLIGLGLAYRALSRPEAALASLEQALVELRQAGIAHRELEALRALMSTWAGLRRPALAIFFGKQAVNTAQRIRSRIGTLDREARTSFLATVEAAYRGLADLLLAEGRLPEAQQVLALLKGDQAGVFLESGGASPRLGLVALTGRKADQARGIEEAMERVGALGRELRAAEAKRARGPEEAQRASGLRGKLAEESGRLRANLDRLPQSFRSHERAPTRLEDLPEVQAMDAELRRLGPGAAALQTLVAAETRSCVAEAGTRGASSAALLEAA